MSLIHSRNQAFKTYHVEGKKVIPVLKSTHIQPPGMWGVLLWRRPSAVLIQNPDGSDEMIKIQDATRKAQLLLLGIGILGSLFISIISNSQKRKEANE